VPSAQKDEVIETLIAEVRVVHIRGDNDVSRNLDSLGVGGLRLSKVLKNTTNMFSKCNILLQEPSALK
jgi:hypothetical protein